jgi:nucleoside-diphosphate-sugar epimerase
MLGYAPKIGLEEGLQRTYRFYVDHPTGEDL